MRRFNRGRRNKRGRGGGSRANSARANANSRDGKPSAKQWVVPGSREVGWEPDRNSGLPAQFLFVGAYTSLILKYGSLDKVVGMGWQVLFLIEVWTFHKNILSDVFIVGMFFF